MLSKGDTTDAHGEATNARLLTIGHSTRSAEDFRALLEQHGVRRLVDVRRFPGSRRYPHFGAEALAESLGAIGIEYLHEPALGGRRSAADGLSPNTYWRSASFRAYADYMATQEFRQALDRLVELAQEKLTAIMCSEAVPWRCHRQLIADAVVVRGLEVVDIIDAKHASPHRLNEHARIGPDEVLVYPANQKELFQEEGRE